MSADRLEAYRTIGPFGAANLPSGLLSRHALKGGTWGCLELLSGEIAFVWDQRPQAPPHRMIAPDRLMIPPEEYHHLVIDGDFVLTITFMRGHSTTGTAAR